MRGSVGQMCPSCKARFKVLDDEMGMHDCPNCGYKPGEEEEGEGCVWCGEKVEDAEEIIIGGGLAEGEWCCCLECLENMERHSEFKE